MRLYLTFLILTYFSCLPAIAQLQKIYLNPKTEIGANQSLFIDSLRFHPLEKNKNVNFSKYSSVITSDKYYIISNSIEKELFFYKKNGAYLKKVAYRKLSEEAYPKYDKQKQQLIFFFTNKNYQLTEKDRINIRSDFANRRNKKYYKKYIIDLTDSSLSIQKSQPTVFDILTAINLKDDLYYTYDINVNKNYKDTIDYEVKLYKNTDFIKGYFPYNKRNETKYLFAHNLGSQTQESQTPGIFYITRPYNDTIFSLANDTIKPFCKLVLPAENSLPASFFITPFKNANERENFERNNGWFFRQLYVSYESGRYLLLYISFLSEGGQYIYDKKTNAAYKYSKIKADSLTYFLPLLSFNFFNNDENKIYTVISSDDLKEASKQMGENAILPTGLKECLRDKNNPQPLIAEYTIKAN